MVSVSWLRRGATLLAVVTAMTVPEESLADKAATEKSVDEIPLGNVVTLELTGRMGLACPATRVPQPILGEDDTDPRSPFERNNIALEGRLGVIYKHLYLSAGFDSYFGGSRDGTSPGIYDARVGFGNAAKIWAKGGPTRVTTISSRSVDKYGTPCPEIKEYDDNPAPCIEPEVEVTTTTSYLDVPPGWVKIWVAGYGGWRHINDMLGSDEPDNATSDLVSGGGPIVGFTAFASGGYWAFELGQELVYYAHGWDDHGSLGYAGRFAFGVPFLLMDLRWHLDPGIGKLFTIGLRARYDWF